MLTVIFSVFLLGLLNYVSLRRHLKRAERDRSASTQPTISTYTFSTFQLPLQLTMFSRLLSSVFRYSVRESQVRTPRGTTRRTAGLGMRTHTYHALETTKGKLLIQLTAPRRGRFARICGTLAITDIFLCFRWYIPWTVEQDLYILPGLLQKHIEQQHAKVLGDVLHNPRSNTRGDFVDMRAYRPGDPPRLVLWKQYGKRRELFVRQAETSDSEQTEQRIVLVTSEYDQGAAALAHQLTARVQNQAATNPLKLTIWGEPSMAGTADQLPKDIVDRIVDSSMISTTINTPKSGDILVCDSSVSSMVQDVLDSHGLHNHLIELDSSSLISTQ